MVSEASLPDEVPGNVPNSESTLQPQESMTRAIDYYTRLENLLTKIEERTRSVDDSDDESYNPHYPSSEFDAPTHSNAAEAVTGIAAFGEQSAPLLPKVRVCDWEHFVNRFSLDDRTCIIDVLVAGYELGKDIAAEKQRRQRDDSTLLTVLKVHRIETNSQWIQRVRIHSKVLLGLFSRVTGYTWGTNPHTFVRPFQYLIHFHERFKTELSRLETLLSSTSSPGPQDVKDESELQQERGDNPRQAQSDGHADAAGAEPIDKATLDELRCYIDFAEEKLLPQYNLFRSGNASTPLKIRFDDLWYLFRAGDLVYVPQGTPNDVQREIDNLKITTPVNKTHKTSMQQKIWRISYVCTPKAYPSFVEYPEDTESRYFYASCYYLDFDGMTYGAVERKIEIRAYEGEKNIQDLDFYPFRFVHNADDIMQQHINQGRNFTSWISKRHAICNGWTFVTDPAGMPLTDPTMASYRHVQGRSIYIEGEVIIDFKEAFNHRSDYTPLFVDNQLPVWKSSSKVIDSPHCIIDWTDEDRSISLTHSGESVIVRDDCNVLEAHALCERDRYLTKDNRTDDLPEGEDLALMPPRVFVYALTIKLFAPVNCSDLKPVPVQKDVFDQLQLPEEHKRIIQAAVHSHLRKSRLDKEIESKAEVQLQTQDFIIGKGRGLIILLHGEPGVGKTATAEAVAHATRRPLFPVACSTLAEGHVLDPMLSNILRLAHKWECVLLLDEADVILGSRANNPMWSSILVSGMSAPFS